MSVRDNIRFARPDASDEQVVEAAKVVGAHEFILRLPGGYAPNQVARQIMSQDSGLLGGGED